LPAVIHSLKPVSGPKAAPDIASKPRRSRIRAAIGFIAREPFFQFLLMGLLIWGGVEYWRGRENHYAIHVGPAEQQRIAGAYTQQFGQTPTPEQLQSLLDRYVREEIHLREGLALGLDKDDEIVRRRIVQKYEFLQTDLTVADAPNATTLQRWFEQNKERYLTPERVAFSHVYFSPDRDGERAAKARAVQVLEKLRTTNVSRASELGDAFPGPSDLGALLKTETARLFGESELSEKLFDLPEGQWSGPYRSGYGWHLMRVTGRLPAEWPPLENIRERVLTDYTDEQRRLSNAHAFEKLRAKYTIRYDGAGR
jgi:peptidyl-prolyl cis-trans isomerase C